MKIYLNYRAQNARFQNVRSQIPDKDVIKQVRKILKKDKARGELSITFCDDKYMKKLNSHYRGKDKSTDVLSFEFGDKKKIVGDIYISLPTAKRQAKEYNVPLKEEILRLASHGTLHVLGYTHKEMGKYGN